MCRLEALPESISEPKELVAAFRSRRPDGQLNEVDRIVLHAPAFARGWNEIARAVRNDLSLDSKLRELVICAVGHLNGATYEVAKHGPEFLAAGGSPEQLEALNNIDAALENGELFDIDQRAALKLALEMTRDVIVNDETFEDARKCLGSSKKVVELVGCISMYNMVARLLVALKVQPDNG
jgi:alkylhydroperoxidase family enzyme